MKPRSQDLHLPGELGFLYIFGCWMLYSCDCPFLSFSSYTGYSESIDLWSCLSRGRVVIPSRSFCALLVTSSAGSGLGTQFLHLRCAPSPVIWTDYGGCDQQDTAEGMQSPGPGSGYKKPAASTDCLRKYSLSDP